MGTVSFRNLNSFAIKFSEKIDGLFAKKAEVPSVPEDAKFTDTTYEIMGAATESGAGTSGLVPAPSAGSQTKFLRGDGTWQTMESTAYSEATTTQSGLLSAGDKKKLDEFTEVTDEEIDAIVAGIFNE